MAKVFLSAGHGGSDPGAVAYGMKEKDINLNILLACNEVLVRHGVTTVLSRKTDANDPVADEVKEANASKADIAVSFHTNAGGGDGSETFYYSKSTKGKKLAELCEKHTKAIGQNSRGVKATTSLWFLKKTNMVAALCECAFIDNNKDNDIIDTVAEQKKFGVAYAKAILEYLGITYKEAVTTTTTTTNTSTSFKVKFKENMNVRVNAGTKYALVPGEMCKKDYVYTIVGTTKVGTALWGKLKSGAGWVCIANKYCTRV